MFLVWAGVTTLLYQFSENKSSDPGELVVATIAGLLYSAGIFGLTTFITATSYYTYNFITGAERTYEESQQQAATQRAALDEARRLQEIHAAATQRQKDEREKAQAQRRREHARAACELLYALHAPEISQRFPRSELDRFLRTYMSDAQPPDEVERRSLDFQLLIDRHRQLVKPDAPKTIQALAQWYLHEKQRIVTLPLDEDLKQLHLMQLDYRYAELSEELLKRAQP